MTRALHAALGVWLLLAPTILHYSDPASTNDRIVGAVLAALAIVHIGSSARLVRWCNILVGLWLLIVPAVLEYTKVMPTLQSFAVGAATIGCTLVSGQAPAQQGSGMSKREPPQRL